jgi:hypothetical protein
MNKYRLKKYKIMPYTALFLIMLTACASKVEPQIKEEVTPQPTSTKTVPAPVEITPTKTITQEIIYTQTPDLRLPPEQWQNWPIIPVATNRTIDIFKTGLAKGVNPKAFSKIGDCQNVKESFMGIYDKNIYFLQDWQNSWQETIDQFKGYFNRDSLAFGQGLNVAAALSPLHADPTQCQPSENPVQCELRVINPAYAFIRFERWYPDVTPPKSYEKYLRQIIEIVINNGTVPILMTKADNIEGSQQINSIIAKLAYEYDIPLYNWWKAAQALPNRGLDPVRDDKFHIDPKYAWTEQSAYGLGTLDSIWKGTKGN